MSSGAIAFDEDPPGELFGYRHGGVEDKSMDDGTVGSKDRMGGSFSSWSLELPLPFGALGGTITKLAPSRRWSKSHRKEQRGIREATRKTKRNAMIEQERR